MIMLADQQIVMRLETRHVRRLADHPFLSLLMIRLDSMRKPLTLFLQPSYTSLEHIFHRIFFYLSQVLADNLR